MIPTRFLRLILVALSVSSTAQALHPNRILTPRRNAAIKRQGDDDSNPADPTQTQTTDNSQDGQDDSQDDDQDEPTPTDDGDSPTETTGEEPTLNTPATSPPDEPTTEETTTTDEQSTTRSATPATTTTARETTSDTTESPTTTPAAQTSDSSAAPSTTRTSTFLVTITGNNGEVSTQTSVTTSTGVPSLSGEEDNETSGMSDKTRNTIIGVVGGVGGAIVLAAIGFGAWKIRSRRRLAEESDGLIPSYGGYTRTASDKPDGGSMSGNTPFQSTLESYHAPSQVNKAANF